jgi:hypothetical protein
MPQFTVDPLVNPGEWDVLYAAGIPSPGIFALSGGPREYKWDVKDAPGVQGAFITYRGWRPTQGIKGIFQFWLPGQVEEFYRWAQVWALDARKLATKPVDVYHPALAANEINALVTKSFGPLVGTPQQMWSVTLEWIEWRPARIIKADTPQGATARLGRPTPQNKMQAEIAKEQELARRPL